MRYITITSVLLACLVGGCSFTRGPSQDETSSLQSAIENGTLPAFVSRDDLGRNHWDSTKQVYTVRQFRPVQSSADAIVKTLENAPAEGLDPRDYDLAGLHALLDSLKASPDPEKKQELDLHLTYSLVRYVSQLCFGRIDPKVINPDWPETGRNCDVDQIVFDALEQNTVENLAEQLSPKIPEYQGLKAVLQHYRDIAAKGGWQPVPVDVSKKRGVRGLQENSAVLTAYLTQTGDLTSPDHGPDTSPDNARAVSAEALKDAMSRFQSRNGLQPNEKLDEKSVRAMNVSVEQRIEQIEINMDRMRWIAHRLEPRHILVNIPGFHLTVHDGGQTPLQMRAIVGSTENPTPVLDDEIEYVVFSPYWNIPLEYRDERIPTQSQKGSELSAPSGN